MPKHAVYLCALLLVAPLLAAKDEPTIPKLIANARFVLVTTYSGDNPGNPSIMPEDRQAVADVQSAIQKWGKYTLVYERKNADLIFLVRKGRIVEALPGVRVHTDSEKPRPTTAPIITADAGDPQDMLAVYDALQGIDSPPLWRGRKPDGLKPPHMLLVNDLRAKVEAADKKP